MGNRAAPRPEAGALLTLHFGPNEVLLNLDIEFRHDLSTGEVAAAVDRLETAIRERHPDVKRVFIEAEHLTGKPRQAVQRRPIVGST